MLQRDSFFGRQPAKAPAAVPPPSSPKTTPISVQAAGAAAPASRIDSTTRASPPEATGQPPQVTEVRGEGSRGSQGPVAEIAAGVGTDVATFTRERPGMSAFVLDDGIVYHTYSAYARGLDGLWGAYQWLDRAPKGRNETGSYWWHRHDEYDKA